MSRRHLTVALIAVVAWQLAVSCQPAADITIQAPVSDVTTFSFSVQFEIAGSSLDLSTLQATLNDEPITVSGGPVYTATVNPGFPLKDANVLRVSAKRLDAETVVTKRQDFKYVPPKARAFVLAAADDPATTEFDESDRITGPLAHNQADDYMLQNTVARFAVQRAGLRDLHSVGQFGGNLIDAALVGKPGLDSFFEVQPSLNIESVVNATSITIVNNGQDGTAAIVRSCGPDDLLDYINASSQAAAVGGGLPGGVDDLDYNITACNTYTLEPGEDYVTIDTEVTNNETFNLGLFVGDYLNGMGEFEQFMANPLLSSGDAGIGELFATGGIDFLTYYGIGEAEGVSYTLTQDPDPLGTGNDSSSFTTSGVSFVLYGHNVPLVLAGLLGPDFTVAQNGGKSTFTRYFGVGDGDGASGTELVAKLRSTTTGSISGCVTVAGTSGATPVPGATVVVGTPDPGPIDFVQAVYTADASGCYAGTLPEGSYSVAAAKRGWAYEGGGATPTYNSATIASATPEVIDIELPNTGTVTVNAQEETPGPTLTDIPARVTVVGFDPSPEVVLTGNISFNVASGLFSDPFKDPIPFGVVYSDYTDSSGSVTFDLEPGTYQVFVSRGTEYSSHNEEVILAAGGSETVNATLHRVLDTTGFVSSDFHVHQINSPDSRISHNDRASQYAGEGVENLVLTDHDAHATITPEITALGLGAFLASTVGEEITSFDTGHYNSYPRNVDATRPSGGSTDWGGAEIAGQDFPSFGNWVLTPAEIYAAAVTDPNNTAATVAVQVNHFDDHFGPLQIDTGVDPPSTALTNAEAAGFRLPPSTEFFFQFPALEVWNGYTRSHALTEFLNGRIGVWMNLINQGRGHSSQAAGYGPTAIADTDSHEYLNLRSGGARAWTASASDAIAGIDGEDVAEAVVAGRAVGGQGIYVQTRLLQTEGSEVADLTLTGSTRLDVNNDTSAGAGTGRELDLEIHVQAPLWAEYDTIEIYANAATDATGSTGGTPTRYTACPTLTYTLSPGPTPNFTRSTVNNYVPSITGADRYDTLLTVRVPDDIPSMASLAEDTWFVVVVKGTDGGNAWDSEPMFPEMPASLNKTGNTTLANLLDGNSGEGGVQALGFTNALYASVNDDSDFDAPGVNVVGSCP
ncbi:MAG: carboxypeptidase-like regulatory domain-containing protein [Myxococcales bacterium]|nr:carboxypeptidase-like regulatory domain-containing protein [Myxococcales bacterium]